MLTHGNVEAIRVPPPAGHGRKRILFAAERMKAMFLYLRAGEEIPPHNGRCDVVLYIVNGTGVVAMGEERVSVQAGSVVGVPADVVRGVESTGELGVLWVTSNCTTCTLERLGSVEVCGSDA